MTAARSQSPSALCTRHTFTLSRSRLGTCWETWVQQLEAMGRMAAGGKERQYRTFSSRAGGLVLIGRLQRHGTLSLRGERHHGPAGRWLCDAAPAQDGPHLPELTPPVGRVWGQEQAKAQRSAEMKGAPTVPRWGCGPTGKEVDAVLKRATTWTLSRFKFPTWGGLGRIRRDSDAWRETETYPD